MNTKKITQKKTTRKKTTRKKTTKRSPKRPLRENVFQDGPHLLTAVVCERVLVEKDGVKTAVRMVDRFTRTIMSSAPGLDTIPPMTKQLTLLVRFKKGKSGSKHDLKLAMINPDGNSAGSLSNTIVFEGGADRGVDMVLNLDVRFDQDGVYWIDLYLDEIRVTRIPMRAIFIIQKQQARGEDQTPVN